MVASWKTTWLRIETSIGRNPVIGYNWMILDGWNSLPRCTDRPCKMTVEYPKMVPWAGHAIGRFNTRLILGLLGWCQGDFGILWWRLPATIITIHKKKSNGEKCEGLHLVSTRIVFPYLCLSENRVPWWGTSNSNGSWWKTTHENDVTWMVYTILGQTHLQTEYSG